MLKTTFLFITLQALALVRQSFQECHDIDPPEHGQIRIDENYQFYRVACEHGYILHGNPVVYCNNNEWENPLPKCVESSRVCKEFSAPENGRVNCDEGPLTVGKRCRIECNEGYVLQGLSSKSCRPDFRWSGERISTTCIKISSQRQSRIRKHPVTKNSPNPHEVSGVYTSTGHRYNPCENHKCEQLCKIESGRAQCRCNRGFILNETDQTSCIKNTGEPIHKRNACSVGNGGCDQFCTPTHDGNVFCSCRADYRRAGRDLKRCIKITIEHIPSAAASCQINKGGCDHHCKDGETGVQCSCENGYQLHSDGKHCFIPRFYSSIHYDVRTDVSCQYNNGGCEHYCNDRGSRIQCSCANGYELHSDGKHCTVPSPYIPSADSCQFNNGGCEHFCDDRGTRIECSCQNGYELHSDGKHCIDIDECRDGNLNNCEQLCDNMKGSYRCHCRPGYVPVDGYMCQDINECLVEHLNNCQHICTNTEGSYQCSCKPGYVLLDGHKCQGCGKNAYWSPAIEGCAQCPKYSHTDSEGKTSIKDCICNSGFVGNPVDGEICEDINECLDDKFGCSDTCVNIPGSAYCSCPVGFQLDIDNKTCVDIDECSIKNGGCEGECINLHGDFRCSCPEGFAKSNKDHYSCDDVDECQVNNGGCDQKCINYRGGYYCACEKGYRLDSSLKTCTDVQCPSLPVPPRSYMTCEKDGRKLMEMENYPIGTICTFKCDKGFKIRDSKMMECLENGTWEGNLPRCDAQNCDPLEIPENGAVHPSICSTQGNAVKQRCAFTCKPGYRLEGKVVLTCQNDLEWSYEVPVCQLVNIKPTIECPSDVTVIMLPGQSTHNITLEKPKTNVDYYRVHPEWVNAGESTEFPAGVTKVTFTSDSPNSNKTAKCAVTVTVLDKEPPVFEYCPDPIKIEGVGGEGEFVTWDEPVVTDNVQVESVFSLTEPNTTFAPGTYVVEYIARDTAGNIASCSFNVSISRMTCSNLADPAHGEANCMDWMFGKFCQPRCDTGYMRNPDDPPYYSCDDSGIWEPSEDIGECLQFITATSSSCPDGFMLAISDETSEEICVECSSSTIWSSTTKMCEKITK